MNAIGSALSMTYPNPTIENLVNAVYDFVVNTYMEDAPPLRQVQSLKSSIYAMLNGYLNIQNGEAIQLNAMQMMYVYELIDGTLETRNPEDIKQHIINMEEKITASKLTANEQMPLLFATAVGKASYDYWALIIPTASLWSSYINTFTPPINKFPFWIASSMQGTLIGLSMYQNNMTGKFAAELELLLNYLGANNILALYGSLSVSAGKVVFNLQHRPISDTPFEGNALQDYNLDCGCK